MKICPKCHKEYPFEAKLCSVDGTILIVQDKLIGKTIDGRYQIVEKIGEGGMGVVYKVRQIYLDEFFALKIILQDLAKDPEFIERFRKEAKTAVRINHPNAIIIHDFGVTEDGLLFLSMEYLESPDLSKLIKAYPNGMPLEVVLEITNQLCSVLSTVHQKGIIHRDLKPANIMVAVEEDKPIHVKVLDFGLAKAAGQTRLTKTNTTLGTVAYMSPEQARGEEVDHRSDIFSVGIILYEMLTGQLPFKGDYAHAVLYSILNEEPDLITNIRPDIPLELQQIVNKAMQKQPENRYQSVEALAADLEVISKLIKDDRSKYKDDLLPSLSTPATTPKESIIKQKPKFKERIRIFNNIWIWSSGILIGLLLVIFLFWPEKENFNFQARQYTLFKLAGDSLSALGKYYEALVRYDSAMTYKPNDLYVSSQKDSINQMLSDEEEESETERKYTLYKNEGDALFQQGDYNESNRKYKAALIHKPGDAYLLSKIEETKQRIADGKAKVDNEKRYTQFKDEGDSLFQTKDYIDSRRMYQAAIILKPGDNYAIDKIQEINQIIGEETAKAEKDKLFMQFKTKGDSLFQSQKYLEAKLIYMEALKLKDNDPYTIQKIQECTALIAKKTPVSPQEEMPIVPLALLTEKPVFLNKVKPDYPRLAKRAGIKGKVLVRVLIDTKGNVEKVEILESHPTFDKEARAAAMQCKFKPGKQGNKFVRTWFLIDFEW